MSADMAAESFSPAHCRHFRTIKHFHGIPWRSDGGSEGGRDEGKRKKNQWSRNGKRDVRQKRKEDRPWEENYSTTAVVGKLNYHCDSPADETTALRTRTRNKTRVEEISWQHGESWAHHKGRHDCNTDKTENRSKMREKNNISCKRDETLVNEKSRCSVRV